MVVLLLQVTLTVNADGSADLKLVDIAPLVFVADAKPASFFLPAAPRKLLVRGMRDKSYRQQLMKLKTAHSLCSN